jgi:methylated-DNA-[protein]-cysteine S-methyltransferase
MQRKPVEFLQLAEKQAVTKVNGVSYAVVPSPFGVISLIWQETGQGPKVRRVLLPSEQTSTEKMTRASFPGAIPASCPAIADLGERIQVFLGGKPVDFTLTIVALETCSEFQRRVLLAEYEIPRGWVSTYQRIARHLAVQHGARAVGRALARNPFPIIIPCHRAVRSNWTLGGFQGGLKMKRALLELEGVGFSRAGKVHTDRIYY